MIEDTTPLATVPPPAAGRLEVEPFLHYGPERIYNTLNERFLDSGDAGFRELQDLREGRMTTAELDPELGARLVEQAWLVESGP